MKIIDWERKGNVVRFYLGADDCDDYWGDDWNDRPYEHNADKVYDEYIKGHCDIAFPFDCDVLEPADDWYYNGNSPFSKEDFKSGKAPFLVVLMPEVAKGEYYPQYNQWAGGRAEGVLKFYFDDPEYLLDNVRDILSIKE